VRFELGAHFVDLVEKHLLLIGADSALQRPPEGRIAGVRVVLVVEGEQSGIAHHAVIEACRFLVPQLASERSLEGVVVDEVLLVGGEGFNFERLGEGGDVGDGVGLGAFVVVALPQTFSQTVLCCDFVEH
jgi:hypothetical protein